MNLELDEAEGRLVHDALRSLLPLLSVESGKSALAIQGRIDVGILEDSAEGHFPKNNTCVTA